MRCAGSQLDGSDTSTDSAYSLAEAKYTAAALQELDQLDGIPAIPQVTGGAEEDMAHEGDAASLWIKAQRLLSRLVGCPHRTLSLAATGAHLPGTGQLEVPASSEPAAEGLPSSLISQQMDILRPLKITVLLNSMQGSHSTSPPQASASVPGQAQQAPLMMQKDGVVRRQKLANLLQSLRQPSSEAYSAEVSQGERLSGLSQPSVLVTDAQPLGAQWVGIQASMLKGVGSLQLAAAAAARALQDGVTAAMADGAEGQVSKPLIRCNKLDK